MARKTFWSRDTIILTNFVTPTSKMLHTKSSGLLVPEKIFEGFWSCDQSLSLVQRCHVKFKFNSDIMHGCWEKKMVTLKIRSRPNLTNTMIQYIKFGQNPFFDSKDNLRKPNFGQKLTFQSATLTLKISLIKIHITGSEDRVRKRLIHTVFIGWWPWKLGQGHPNQLFIVSQW